MLLTMKKIGCNQMKEGRLIYCTDLFDVYWSNPLTCYRTDSEHNNKVVNCMVQEVGTDKYSTQQIHGTNSTILCLTFLTPEFPVKNYTYKKSLKKSRENVTFTTCKSHTKTERGQLQTCMHFFIILLQHSIHVYTCTMMQVQYLNVYINVHEQVMSCHGNPHKDHNG